MPEPWSGPPVVALPRPIDRRMRFGPFARPLDAIKFVGYAAAGALLLPFLGAPAWVLCSAAGFLVSVWRPDGESLEERASRWIGWQGRRLGHRRRVKRVSRTDPRGARLLRPGEGPPLAILRTVGTPIAYRPPVELERLFRSWGELLRTLDGPVAVRAGTAPLAASPLLPGSAPATAEEEPARAGYHELVEVLCRRRLVRRVDVALVAPSATHEGAVGLERAARSAEEQLRALGLRPVRLVGRALAEAAHRFGWAEEGVE